MVQMTKISKWKNRVGNVVTPPNFGPVFFEESQTRDIIVCLLCQSVYQSPCSTFCNSWIPPQDIWTSLPAAVYYYLLLLYIDLDLWRNLPQSFQWAYFHFCLTAYSWNLAKCVLNIMHRGCKQFQIVSRDQAIDPAMSNSDIFLNLAVTVYPIHIDYKKGGACFPADMATCYWLAEVQNTWWKVVI